MPPSLEDKLVADFIKEHGGTVEVFYENWLRSAFSQIREDATIEEQQFFLNILDGVDIADESMGLPHNTKAIRFALQSRQTTKATRHHI